MDVIHESDICITGIAGYFPECDSMKELENKLFDKVDLIKEDEHLWKHMNVEIPKSGGKIKDISKFDASFFGIPYKHAHIMDPKTRLTLERVFECIIDAGVNPSELRNTNTAVIIGTSSGESEKFWMADKVHLNNYGFAGCTHSSMPGHISDWLGLKGPSYIVDTACSSSLYGFDQAFKMIRDGSSDAAIVIGSHLILHPYTTLCFARMGVLCTDGRCKCFDERANGYVRSESIVACFIQKYKDSRRVYAHMIYAKTNCDGYKEKGISYPSGKMQMLLLSKFYQECDIRPSSVEYIEAHGTGTRVGDPEELSAIDEIFCSGRTEPLLIGSIKSNLGHCEPSSGSNSVAKLCIAYNTGYIPPNINFKTPRQEVPALVEGRIKVVTEKQPWNRGFATVSSFGFGGANAHVLMKSNAKNKINNGLPSDSLPRLVCVSGRTESAVAKILDDLESRPVDVDEIRLWHAINEHDIKGHQFRGFVLLSSTQTKSVRLARDIQHNLSNVRRPVWFIYSSLGLHWPAIAIRLMNIPIFTDAIRKCHVALETKKIDLLFNIYNQNEEQKDLTLIGHVAVFVGLIDILKAIGIKPVKNVMSVSINYELCCSYADGSLSAEQTILAAYNIYIVSKGSHVLQKCHQSEQRESKAKLASVEYLADSVKDQDDSTPTSLLTSNEIVIDMGMDGNNTFDKLTYKQITVVKLVEENMGVQFLFSALGKLFEMGLNPRLANIYPTVEFPVAQSTPMLSHLVEWNHQENWWVNIFGNPRKIFIHSRIVQVSLKADEFEYIAGHIIDGRVIFPATGYLVLVWETLASLSGRLYTEVSVIFSDVYFHRATNMPKTGGVEFTITLHRASGRFEILENGTTIVTGYIKEKKNVGKDFRVIPELENSVSDIIVRTKDFYKELSLRGYQHKDLFRGVKRSNVDGTRSILMWNNNWVVFLDTMLQLIIIAHDTRSLYIPTRIENIYIDVELHYYVVSQTSAKLHLEPHETLLECKYYPDVETVRAGGVEITGTHVTAISKKPPLGIPIYEKHCFIPNYNKQNMEVKDAMRINIQLILENIEAYKFKSAELVDKEYKANKLLPIIEEVGDVLADMPLVQAELMVLSKNPLNLPANITVANKKPALESNVVLFIGANLFERREVLIEMLNALKDKAFILSRENTSINSKIDAKELDIIATQHVGSEYFILLRKKIESIPATYVEVSQQDYAYSWINEVKKITSDGQKVVLYNRNEIHNGLLGLVNCLRRELDGDKVNGVLISDLIAPKFDPYLPFYKEQLDKQLGINVFKDGKWGTYRHLLLEEIESRPVRHAYLKQTVIGDLSSLRWLEGPLSDPQNSNDNIIVQVYCSALNFRDAMTAIGRVTVEAVAKGRLEQECVQGIEVSGKTSNGTRIMGICVKGFSNLIEADLSVSFCVPDEWSLAEAATVPMAYMTAYMSLVLVGKMRRGESVLIHAGSGAVGQAAINVALHHGLEVFTTVGTPAKRDFIKRLFPQIKDSHIGNSRDTSFEYMIHRETNGKGVHLVLNSLADDKLQASIKCLGHRGRFLEIGKYDITMNTQIETCFLKKEISFHGVMLDFIREKRNYLLRKKIFELMVNGIVSGAVRPITHCVFEKEEIEAGFRYMAAGKHVGKVIIKMCDEESDDIRGRPTPKLINAIPRYMCNSNCVYILVGGLGGFGLELADWLVLRGARKLLFSSRRGVSNGYQALRLKIWKSYGTQIEISTDDITTEAGCESLLKTASAMGPVRAIFNLAVVLRDTVFLNQTPETFRTSFAPKALATIYLDKYSRLLCPDLRDFVVFSSASCGRGNSGQTNYGFSNSVMERVCEERKRQGLPALAIQWGAIGDVGLIADMQEDNIQKEISGTLQQRISSCLQAMDKLMKQDAAIVSSIVVAEKRVGGVTSGSIVEVIAQIIGIGDVNTISRQVPLSEMGMDSVMTLEIKQTLERDFEINLSAQEIRMVTFAKLLELTSTPDESYQGSSPVESSNKSIIKPAGIEILLKHFDDEKTAFEPYIYLPTLASGSEDNGANNEDILFLLPGLESCAEIFNTLCSKLETRACVLQLGVKHAQDDLEQITNSIYETVSKILPPGASFKLLGYSFGSLPILELAARLERDGHKGLTFCLDGSPEFTSELAKIIMKTNDDNQVQNSLICHVFNIMQSNQNVIENAMAKLNSIESFDDKIKCAVELSPTKVNHSIKFLSVMVFAIYKRMKLLLNNKSSNIKISSPIVLMRQKVIPATFKCGENYGLDKYTNGPVKVYYLDSDHYTIVDNHKCAEIINETLSDFKGKCKDSNMNK